MVDTVTILWAATGEGLSLVRAVARGEGATVMAASIETLPSCAAAASQRGGVVAVMAGASDATFAYRAGVDVVLMDGAVTERSLAASIAEARERGRARMRRAGRSEPLLADVGEAMAVLRELLRCEVERPMINASVECSGLHDEVDGLLRIIDVLAEWAALVAPASKLESVARAIPASAPGLVSGRLRRIQASILTAEQHLEVLRDLCSLEGDSGCVNVTTVARLLSEPLARHCTPVVLRVMAHDDCVARVPRPVFVCMLLALIEHARQAVRESPGTPGSIEVRVASADQEDTVVVDVFYTGEKEALFGPDVFASGGYASVEAGGGLVSLRERARQHGGELLLEEDEAGMTARLLMPTPAAEVETGDRVSGSTVAARERWR
jgi:hypothetical protein